MKIGFLFLTNIISLSIIAQVTPRFNPLVDINRSKKMEQVISNLKKSREFVLSSYQDTLATGTYQNQKIKISKSENEIDNPDSSFLVVITFNSKFDFEAFLKAGRKFFTQTGNIFEYKEGLDVSCEEEIFEKKDFTPLLLNIVFAKCSTSTNQKIYQLSFKPYRMTKCGVK